jgi:predicted ATPase
LLDEALRLAKETDGCWCEAELHRLKGMVFASGCGGREAEAESCFDGAIAVARQQDAKLWELRATAGLARLRRDQGRHREAHALLAPVYAAFIEGFAFPDLVGARALLDELGPAPGHGADWRQEEVRTARGPDRFREPVPGRVPGR